MNGTIKPSLTLLTAPVVKGTRIPVAVILDQLASGETWESILKGYPELTREDIQAALLFAKASVEHTEIIPSADQ